jgi:FKBP-type peptidyl-prolyl cis-trans isomerase
LQRVGVCAALARVAASRQACAYPQIGKKQQIVGLEKGIMGMKPGEQRQLFIKADLAYGEDGVCLDSEDEEEEGQCLVPPNTDLVFDVTLVNTGPAPNN